MATHGGINTVMVNGEYQHITVLDNTTLCSEWSKRQREINELYNINAKANEGWRGVILKLIGVQLPDNKFITIGGIHPKSENMFSESK